MQRVSLYVTHLPLGYTPALRFARLRDGRGRRRPGRHNTGEHTDFLCSWSMFQRSTSAKSVARTPRALHTRAPWRRNPPLVVTGSNLELAFPSRRLGQKRRLSPRDAQRDRREPDARPTRSFAHPNLVVTTTSKSDSINTRSDGALEHAASTCPADGPRRSRRKDDVRSRHDERASYRRVRIVPVEVESLAEVHRLKLPLVEFHAVIHEFRADAHHAQRRDGVRQPIPDGGDVRRSGEDDDAHHVLVRGSGRARGGVARGGAIPVASCGM